MTTETEKWTIEDFHRRAYNIQSDDFNQHTRIEVIVLVNGRKEIQLLLPEPGLLAIVSRPDDEGLQVERVGPGANLVTDIEIDTDKKRPMEWQQLALFGTKPS